MTKPITLRFVVRTLTRLRATIISAASLYGQEELLEMARAIEARRTRVYLLSEDERAAIDAARRSAIASDEKVREFWERFGAPTPIRSETYSPVPSESKKLITLALSSADASPPYGFILLPGTISSGLAMKRFSFASSQTKSALFIALE